MLKNKKPKEIKKVPRKLICPICHYDLTLTEENSENLVFKCGSVYRFDNGIFKELEACPNLPETLIIKNHLLSVHTAKVWQELLVSIKPIKYEGWGKNYDLKKLSTELITLSEYARKISNSTCEVSLINWMVIYDRIMKTN